MPGVSAYLAKKGFIPHKRVCRILIVRHLSRSEVGITLNIGVYERKTDFSLPFRKYWSKLQTVSEKKLCIDPNKSVRVIIFWSEVPKIRGVGGTPFLP